MEAVEDRRGGSMPKLRIIALTYKTFPATLPVVYEATVDALKQMRMRVLPQELGVEEGSVGILASGWRRQFEVEMASSGIEGTRVRVLAKEGVFFEENAASDLIAQVARLLERPPSRQAAGHVATKSPSISDVAVLAG